MKIRLGFVSNSSSSSFMIDRSKITYEQDVLIQTVCNEVDKAGNSITEWKVFLTNGSLIGYTHMDNFDMQEFFDKICIPKEAIHWAIKEVSSWVGDNPDYDDLSTCSNLMEKTEQSVLKKIPQILKEMGYK